MTSEERYKNGKIYTIRYRGDDSLVYVGSTCLPLYKRWYSHKSSCFGEKTTNYNKSLYKKMWLLINPQSPDNGSYPKCFPMS